MVNRHKKETEQRRREAKRKLEQQRRDEQVQKAMEQEQAEREEERLKEEHEARRRIEQERLLNDGVSYRKALKPFPSARADDKLILPQSALEALEKQGALEHGMLSFSVSLPSAYGGVLGKELTHAGVAEFTAEEDTVGVPPRVALCLSKGAGVDSLASVPQVEVHYVRLPKARKSTVKFQPRGEGFHAGGLQAVRMDLEHVLQESLRGHTALTVGDWLPIRHNGITYELVVKELEPEPQLSLIDTDLTVEVLPSEQTEAELAAEAERKAREEEAARQAAEQERLRLARAAEKMAALPAEPPAGPTVVQLLLRLPTGGRLQRRFPRDEHFATVLDWVEAEESTRVKSGDFRLVQKWPGHVKELGPSESKKTLSSLQFARQEALFLQHVGEEQVPIDDGDGADETKGDDEGVQLAYRRPAAMAPLLPADAADASAWTAAEDRARQLLDRRVDGLETPTHDAAAEPQLQHLEGQELVAVFERLVAFGMPPQNAAAASKKYAAQLRELGDMGFDDWPRAVRLLDKYQGRLLRVANLLAEPAPPEELAEAAADAAHVEDSVPPDAAAPASDPAPVPLPVPRPAAPTQHDPAFKAAVTEKFKELVAGGMPPNDAATRAIQLVRAEQASAAAAPPAPEVAAAPAPAGYDEQLQELAAMGFTDVDRNLALLRKYAGRMERVIEALC